jgi:hypothetical protein
MNSLRKVLGFAMTVLMLGAFALSSGAATAADKTYELTLTPAAGTSPIATMTATLTNKGNSSFNSFTLTLPANYSLLGTPTVSAGKGTVSYNPSTRVITVLNIGLPVGSGTNQVVTVTMANVATAGASCAAGVPGNWTAAVWTGSGLTGSPFGNFGTYPVPTSINPLCYTATPSPGAHGSMTPSTPQTVAPNAQVTFTVTPDATNGYHIASVTGCGVTRTSGDGNFQASGYQTALMTGSCTVSATFALNTYMVTYSAGSGGIISPSGAVAGVTWGATPTFAVTPNTNPNPAYSIASVTASPTGCSAALQAGQGDGQFLPSTYKAGAVTQDCTFTASFVADKLTITSQPTSAAVGAPFNVTIGNTPGGAAVTMNPGTCVGATASSTPTGNPVTSTAFLVTIPAMPTGGVCSLTFSAPNYDPITLSSLKVYGGVLNCNGSLGNISITGGAPVDLGTGLDPTTGLPVPGWAAGNRGINDKNGPCSLPVDYTFTNSVLSGNSTNLTWDVNAVPGAAIKYTVNWKPEYVGATGMPIQRTYVQWFGLNAPAAPVPGRACVAQNQDPVAKDFLPRPYGTLSAAITNAQLTINVSPSVTLPTAPFAITIDSERMLVSAISGTTWTVVRGDGSTPPDTHLANAYVMSNPLPVYYPNGITFPSVQMEMCIADEGFAIVPAGANDCTTSTTPSPNPSITLPTTPTSCAAVTTTLYDIGDGNGVRAP